MPPKQTNKTNARNAKCQELWDTNAWGFYDMHGNVWEWCADRWDDYPSGSVTAPRGAETGVGRVRRGGSWSYVARYCRSADRNLHGPGFRYYALGFRLALKSVEKKAQSKPIATKKKQQSEQNVPEKKSPAPTENGNSPRTVALSANVSLELLPVAAGSFKMGSENGDSNEKPVHQVTISKPFWLGKTEVTQAQWQAVMGSNPSRFKGADRPVECVSWNDADAFCKKLTERERSAGRLPTGYEYALPTEAEWEYACRAGSTGDYAGELSSLAWYDKSWDRGHHEVGGKKANAWGFYDMHGNVWEWCADRWGDYPSGAVTDPPGAETGVNRVVRGGSWFDGARYRRSAVRFRHEPGDRGYGLGFRLALKSVRSPASPSSQ